MLVIFINIHNTKRDILIFLIADFGPNVGNAGLEKCRRTLHVRNKSFSNNSINIALKVILP